jgi:hypothetical protein
MVSIPAQNPVNFYGVKAFCRIVGFTCLAGFLIDILVLGLPPKPTDLEWRLNFLQQVGDRSIILLIGAALIVHSMLDQRRWIKQLATACLVIGVVFHLSCILMIRDSLTLQEITVKNISSQAADLQNQIEEKRNNNTNSANVTLEQLQQASQTVTERAENLKKDTRTNITKVGAASIGNLIVVGLGLINVGRYGLRSRKF